MSNIAIETAPLDQRLLMFARNVLCDVTSGEDITSLEIEEYALKFGLLTEHTVNDGDREAGKLANIIGGDDVEVGETYFCIADDVFGDGELELEASE